MFWMVTMANNNRLKMRCAVDHVPLLSNEDFIRMELDEIRKFQEQANLSAHEAAQQWITRHSHSMREIWGPFVLPKKEMVEKAREEIAKHRWIESEKKGIDLGVEAEYEWIEKYADLFKSSWKT